MTPDEFRRLALKMQGAIEGAHMGHLDFRANGKIFATLYPDGENGMVKLTSDQQQDFMLADPATFIPASGAKSVALTLYASSAIKISSRSRMV